MKIFIGGSSHDDIDGKYLELADEVSKLIAKDNTLILGGTREGIPGNSMMGKYLNNFSSCYYVTVSKYDSKKSENTIILDYTMDRTKELYIIADVIIFLPGGIGTFSEIFSMIEEERTYKRGKKIIIYNYDNYFDNIINCLDRCLEEKFIYDSDIVYKVITNNLELEKEMERL